MIVNSDKRHLETSEGLKVQGFSIDVANPKAFEILSSGIYTNKILAIIREISCNAYDAHIAAGKPLEPITVHMPNALEPWFSVLDNGPGLSHDDVINLYSTYFASTKTTSNDFIGAFGLGSKSPFSYVDAFTVTSRFNGKKRIYSAFKAENGLPSITLMHEEDTTECNGFEVQVPVKSSDVGTFKAEAASFYKYFKPAPNIVGDKLAIKYDDVVVTHNNITILHKSDYTDVNIVMLRQGNVVYPLDTNQIKSPNNMLNNYSYGYDQKVLIDVPIGTFEVTASRESISYTSKTIKALEELLLNSAKEIVEYINDKVDNAASYYDAYEAYTKYNTMFKHNYIIAAFTNIKQVMQYKGKDLKWTLSRYTTDMQKKFTGVVEVSHDFLSGRYRYRRNITNSSYDNNLDFDTFKSGDVVLYVNDVPTNKFSAFVITHRKEFLEKRILILEGTDPEAYIRECLADFEPQIKYSIKKLSEVGAIPSPDRLKNSIIKAISFDNYYSNDPVKMHQVEKVDISKGIKYILANIRNGVLVPVDTCFRQESNRSVIGALVTWKSVINLDTSNVYIVSTRHYNKLLAFGATVTEFKPEIGALRTKLETDPDVLAHLKWLENKGIWDTADNTFINLVNRRAQITNKSAVAIEVFDAYLNRPKATITTVGEQKLRALTELGSDLERKTVNQYYNHHKTNPDLTKFYNAYPLLRHVSSHGHYNAYENAIEYINLTNR